MRDVTLSDGRTIAGGTTVFVAPLVLHHTPALYPDPERFDPDRWLDDAERDPFSYVPFGGGARVASAKRSLGPKASRRIEDRRSLSARTGLRTRSRARRHGDVAAERARYGAAVPR